jgi:Flp pilus assembly protein TadG
MTGRRDSGTATAELAVVLPVLMLVAVAAMTAVSVLLAQLRCVDAAREAARAAARGEDPAVVRSVAGRAAPEGAVVRVVVSGTEVRVDVTAVTGAGILPGLRVAGTAVALREPEPVDAP